VKTQAGIDKTGLFNLFLRPPKNTEKTTSFAAPLREKSQKKGTKNSDQKKAQKSPKTPKTQ
jgi:hypothetical protein